MKVEKIIRLGTPGDASPAIYSTERGTLLLQGYKVDPGNTEGVEGFREKTEDLIEVPVELLLLFAKRNRGLADG